MRVKSLWLAAVMAVSGCHATRSETAPERAMPTTSGSIFFGNLEGQLDVQRQRLAREPASAAAHRGVASLLYVLARHHGDVDEVQAAIDELSRAIELAPDDPALYVQRAQQVQTLHEFASARRDLERARALGGDVRAIESVANELDHAQGRYAESIPAIRRAASERPTMHTVTRLALLEHELGNAAAAEQAFERAETLIDDPSPVPVAWFFLQRGIVALQLGDHDAAIDYLREAIRRTPGYIAAEEHLAETLGQAGHLGEAIALYESIIARSRDPEFLGALARLYRSIGETATADRLAARATAGFDQLIARHPEAMAAHATEFFLGEGRDPQRARTLARADVEVRPTARAFTQLARAELACGDLRAANDAIARALALPVTAPDTASVAADIATALRERGW